MPRSTSFPNLLPHYPLNTRTMSDIPTIPNVPGGSESFGTIPNDSAAFGNVPKSSEDFRTLRQVSERRENHTLTVREAARMFEDAGVARTERSIVNWCQLNKIGIARLDCYFDPNERKYFITPQSVELAIAEEKAKAARPGQEPSEADGTVPNTSGVRSATSPLPHPSEAEPERLRTLEKEVMDLKILNRGKDYFIEQMQKER